MLLGGGFGLLIALGLWLYCLIDVITTPESECRNLPKLAWVFIVLLLVEIGSIAWLIAGKPWNNRNQAAAPKGSAPRYPEYDRPGRHVPQNPDDDEVFLAGLRARAEEQRRRAREQQAVAEAAEQAARDAERKLREQNGEDTLG
jgi:hypothetical protein